MTDSIPAGDSERNTLEITDVSTSRTSVSTYDLLRTLGFQEDGGVLSDEPPGLSFDFGNFTLEASRGMNQWFRPVINIGGIITTERTITVVNFDMPIEVESDEQGTALLAYFLDSHAGESYEPRSPVSWLLEGRRYRHLLPWTTVDP